MVAEVKTLVFVEGLAVSAPDDTQPLAVGTAVSASHALQIGQLAALVLAQVVNVTGTPAAPTSVTAAGGITFSGTSINNTKYIKSNSGAVVISANPQIAAGNFIGQKLRLIYKSGTDTLQMSTGNGVTLLDGADFVSDLDRTQDFEWDGTSTWVEINRS